MDIEKVIVAGSKGMGSCLSFVLQLVLDPGFRVPRNNASTSSTSQTGAVDLLKNLLLW